MKQFNRTTHLALLGGALLGAAWLPRVATAKPFPKRGYILKDKGVADIGRRASTLNAQRAVLRMMARMMRWAPKEESYEVGWTILDAKGREQLGWAYFGYEEDQAPPAPNEPARKPSPILATTNNVVYDLVSRRTIKRVARFGGSFYDLLRYRDTTDKEVK